jgi:lysophospholipase L1-like esterase
MTSTRTSLVALATCLALPACHRQAPVPDPPTPLQARAPQLRGAVVFIGDSRIALLATSNVADRAENLGVSGEDLAGLASRLQGVDLSGASAIVLEAGANDWLSVKGRDFATRYSTVLAELPNRPWIVAAVLPVNEPQVMQAYGGRFDWHGADTAISDWNVRIAALCSAHPSCKFVPTPPELLDGPSLRAQYSTDGVHLNAAGAAIWGAALRQALGAPS